MLASVDEDGPASRAGSKSGDLLLAINGVPLFTRPELWVAMRASDKLEIELVRDRARTTATLAF